MISTGSEIYRAIHEERKILGGDSIGYCEEKVHLWIVTEIQPFEYEYIAKAPQMIKKITVNFYLNFNFVFKWQICYTQMTNVLHFIINVRKSHRQIQCTLLIVCEVRVLFTFLFLCGQEHPKCLVYAPSFCKLHSSTNPTNKNLTHQKRWTKSARDFR
jgi:hypothetical protein